MFVSTDYLAIQYGVDDAIAKFFVDREPPAGNLYWKDKLLYLRFEPGYLFIPLMVDLMYKTGINRQQLLSEEFVQLMEAIGHISAQEEIKRITHKEAIQQCIALARVVSKNDTYLHQLEQYFNEEPANLFSTYTTGINALHRGDLFLFAACTLEEEQEVYLEIVKYWFALISSLLLQDDAEDFKHDQEHNEPNAFIETGVDEAGIEQVRNLVKHNLQLISTLNKTMANKLDKQIITMFQKPFFQQLLQS